MNDQTSTRGAAEPPVHVCNRFALLVRAPLSRAAALFGPQGERCWAGQRWDPQFLFPQPAEDVQGAVFTIQHGPHTSVWVNTLFDTKAGRMQYVSFTPELAVATIDVHLCPVDEAQTRVEVTYARTALNPASNAEVQAMGARDRESGPDWQRAIEGCLTAPGTENRAATNR